ncbi:MAG: HisA/HisF-related TIM barrel protein, partial [Acidimicrobiia bacterium]
GTAAAEEPVRVAELASTFPGSIAIGVDVKDGIVATRGWEVGSGQTLRELLEHYRGSAIAAVIVTEISRDGMLSGPDPTPALEALDLTSAEVVVSGGVGTAVDIALLSDHRSQNGRTIDGVILGRALYEGSVNLREAIDAANAVTRP